MTRFFYDTEFLEDGETIQLLSIGIVREDGAEYYAIVEDTKWDRVRQNEWLMANVVPSIQSADESSWKQKADIAEEVRQFLLSGESKPELWAWYSAYDHVALCQLWGKMIDLPNGIPMFTNDLRSLINWTGISSRLPKLASTTSHDALDDARELKFRFEYVLEEVQRRSSGL